VRCRSTGTWSELLVLSSAAGLKMRGATDD
jgi:hypothetical protein